jgi:hypothetical protein
VASKVTDHEPAGRLLRPLYVPLASSPASRLRVTTSPATRALTETGFSPEELK